VRSKLLKFQFQKVGQLAEEKSMATETSKLNKIIQTLRFFVT
jgi:hypothetical protein